MPSVSLPDEAALPAAQGDARSSPSLVDCDDVDAAYLDVLDVERQALDALEREMQIVGAVVKAAPELSEPAAAAFSYAKAIAPLVVAACESARRSALTAVRRETGHRARRSDADDAERGLKAASYYEREWGKALGAEGVWAERVDGAHASSRAAREAIASYEVFLAYNDERRLAVATLRAQGKALLERWVSKHDGLVCLRCTRNDGKYADEDGEWPEGSKRPPLHAHCRCIIVVEVGTRAALPGEERMSLLHVTPHASTDLGAAARIPVGNPLLRDVGDDEDARLSCAMHVKSIDLARRTVDFVASTDVIDSHDEIIDQTSWVLDDFQKNPVVLFAHQSRELPIGKALQVGVRGMGGRQQLETRIEFAPEEMNPKAEQVFKMLQAEFLRAVSVGFLPKTGRYEMRDGAEVFVWSGCVLKEISVTPVPANPEALAKMKALVPRAQSEAGRAVRELQERAERAAQTTLHPEYEGASAPEVNPPAAPDPNHNPAAPPQKAAENIMSMTNAPEKKDSALEIAELKLEAKHANERAEKAVAAHADLEKKLASFTTEKAAFEAQIATLGEQRDQATARAEKAEAVVVEQEVEALVGKKITPAEKPVFLELRKSNPDLFSKMIEQRTPLALEGTIVAGKDEANGVAKGLAGNDDLVEMFNKGL